MTIDVEVDRKVFNDVYLPHLDNMAETQIYYGGSSSGKSVFAAQRDVIDLMKGGRNILVCRQVGRTLRGSVVQEIKSVIDTWGLSRLFNINKTDGTVTCSNGYQIIFTGLSDVERLKSIVPARGVITDVRIEEATETEKDSIAQLTKRQRGGSSKIKKRVGLYFNPILQNHWIYDEYFKPVGWRDDQTEYISEDLTILKTWYIHNRFLTKQDINRLLNEKDRYTRDVYTYGNWGVLGHVIFTNWEVQDLSGMHDQFVHRRAGLDFGFSSNPAALVCMHYDKTRKTLYIYDELYETGLTNDILAERVKSMIGNDPVTCDSAEPKSIAELQRHGVNSKGAKKGKDSITHGIQWLKQQTIIVDSQAINVQNELRTYQWKDDAGGNATETPIDRNNHLIDSIRYGTEDDANETEVRAMPNPFYN